MPTIIHKGIMKDKINCERFYFPLYIEHSSYKHTFYFAYFWESTVKEQKENGLYAANAIHAFSLS